MAIQINNNFFLNDFLFILVVWGCLDIFALLLVAIRRDFNEVFEDLCNFLFPGKLYLSILGFFIIGIILPFSIPYSIAHFLKK
jgi:hypothetical protein